MLGILAYPRANAREEPGEILEMSKNPGCADGQVLDRGLQGVRVSAQAEACGSVDGDARFAILGACLSPL